VRLAGDRHAKLRRHRSAVIDNTPRCVKRRAVRSREDPTVRHPDLWRGAARRRRRAVAAEVVDSTPRVRDEHGVRTITFDRPSVRNALTLDDLAAVTEAVRDLPTNIRVVVFRGDERAFSAGMHVRTFVDARPDEGRAIIDRVAECVGSVRLAPAVTVAAVRGYCLGAALELALACDLRVADRTARFGLPEVRLGIPSVVDAALLVSHVGLSKAKEVILTGGHYEPEGLPGLANRVVDDVDAAVADLVKQLSELTPEVVRAQKSLFETWLNVGLQQGIDTSRDVFAEVFALPVTQRAIEGYATRS
jgi:enoyl-CoA hydratase